MSNRSLDAVVRQIQRVAGRRAGSELNDRQLLERFARQRDEDAFAELVRRHGALVYGVCRRVLGHVQDAEDAFQATFLVLARKAGSARWRDAVHGWLYEVAFHMAKKAKQAGLRRRAREREACRTPEKASLPDSAMRELSGILDEELHRLPTRYREPVVLCYLEGITRDQAARRLNVPLRTLERRLAQGREVLRARLARRGLTLSVGMLAAGLAGERASAVIPPLLLSSTIRNAAAFATKSARGAIPARVVELAGGFLKAMAATKLKGLVAVLIAVGFAAVGGGLCAQNLLVTHQEHVERAFVPAATIIAAPEQKAERPNRERRDEVGDLLPTGAVARLGTQRFRHGGLTTAVTFAPDGKSLVTIGADGVCTWEIPSGKLLARLPNEKDRYVVGAGVLSPDCKQLASVEYSDKKPLLRVWDVATGKRVREFVKHPCGNLTFSPDSRTLAAFGTRESGDPKNRQPMEEISLWDLDTGQRLNSWTGHVGGAYCGTFARDGKTLITGGRDQAIRLWDVPTGKEIRRFRVAAPAVGHLVLSPDEKLLAGIETKGAVLPSGLAWSATNNVRIWELATGKQLRHFTIPGRQGYGDNAVVGVAFSPDGKGVLTCGARRFAQRWDLTSGKLLREYDLGSIAVWGMALSPDGKTLAALPAGTSVQLIDLASGNLLSPSNGHSSGVLWGFLTPDGKTAFTGGGEPQIIVWDTALGKERKRLTTQTAYLLCLAIAPDGRTLYALGNDGAQVEVWDINRGELLRCLPLPQGATSPFQEMAISPDGKTLVCAGRVNGTVAVIDTTQGRELRRFTIPLIKMPVTKTGEPPNTCAPVTWVAGVAFAPKAGSLAVFISDYSLEFWDIAKGTKTREFLPPGARREASFGHQSGRDAKAFSPDGKLLAYAKSNGSTALCNAATGEPLPLDAVSESGVSAFAFSPDNRTLAWSAWRDPTIHLHEVATGKERRKLVGHRGRVRSLSFSADGAMLISASEDATALVWDLAGRYSVGQTRPASLERPTGRKAGPH
jgi:RNA polymerase sigma factor (sigma-70 family)